MKCISDTFTANPDNSRKLDNIDVTEKFSQQAKLLEMYLSFENVPSTCYFSFRIICRIGCRVQYLHNIDS